MQDATSLTTWTYDEAGRALTKTVTGIGLSTYAYDLTSGIDSLEPGYCAEQTTDPLGGITLKVYDKVDRLAQVTDAGETTQFEYYANGNRKSVTYPDGSKEVYAYNKIGQNTSLINLKADGSVIDTYSYTYDAAGNQTTKTDAKGITTFTYDKLNRLAEVTEPSGIKTTYSFDKAGNRQGEKKYAGASLLQDTSYSYDPTNRLTQTETKMNTTSETEKTLYSYDAAGNMISQSKTTIKPAAIGGQATFVLEKGKASADLVTLYAYDGFNQLKQSDDGISKITYAYNGFGLRTEKSTKANGNQAATVTKYLYEGDKIILELDGSGNKIAKNTFGTNLLSREMAETKVYYMYNGHGDVTALLSETGAIVGTYYYDVWGNILEKNESEQISNPYRYAGYQYDDETGLYYLNARYYDAKIARFLTEDTVTGDRKDPLSLNRYSYCYNNPIVYDDPTGNTANQTYTADGGGKLDNKSTKPATPALGNLTDLAQNKVIWNDKTKTATLSYVDANGKVVNTNYDLGTVDKNGQGKASDGSTFTLKNGKIQVAITETTKKLTGSKPIVNNPIQPPDAFKATNQPVNKPVENFGTIIASILKDIARDTMADAVTSSSSLLTQPLSAGISGAWNTGEAVVKYGDELAKATIDIAEEAGESILEVFAKHGDDIVKNGSSLVFKTGKEGEEYLLKTFGGKTQKYFDTALGKRFIDVFSDGIAHESKVGYASLTDFVKKQIQKDVFARDILQEVDEIVWHFFESEVTGKKGPSGPLYDYLIENGIKVIVH